MAWRTADLTAQLRPITFLVPELFPIGFLSFVAAKQGTGKTMLLTALAWQMTRPAGRGTFLGRPVAHGPVIYVNTDGADNNEARAVRYWLEQQQALYSDGDIDLIKVVENDTLVDREELADLLSMARELGAVCIIIDSFMTTFSGVDGNKLDQVMGPMMALRDFAAKTNTVVIVVDHLPKRMAGEKLGDRGVMGSTGKSAQARSVHIITDASPEDTTGREILRWRVDKHNFARSGYDFGIEVHREFNEEGRPAAVRLEPCELPDQDHRDTRADRATAAVMAHLQASTGDVPHAELVAVAIEKGNLKDRAARDAVGQAVGLMWDRLEVVEQPKRGAPKVYRLKAALDTDCHNATNPLDAMQDSVLFVAESDRHKSATATNHAPAREVVGFD